MWLRQRVPPASPGIPARWIYRRSAVTTFHKLAFHPANGTGCDHGRADNARRWPRLPFPCLCGIVLNAQGGSPRGTASMQPWVLFLVNPGRKTDSFTLMPRVSLLPSHRRLPIVIFNAAANACQLSPPGYARLRTTCVNRICLWST